MKSIRALPRIFIEGVDTSEPFEIPKPAYDKLHTVLKLRTGAEIGVMPNNGEFWICELDGHQAIPKEKFTPNTEPTIQLTLAQALPKGDKIDEIIKSCTELGVAKFVLFPSDRSVVKWDEKKLVDRLRRFQTVAKESAELAFRMKYPVVEYVASTQKMCEQYKDNLLVLSEQESVSQTLPTELKAATFAVGPEGGWSPREVQMLTPYSVTLGPRVLRTEHAGFAACARLLIS
ncbi:MAG TPA: RsmE family RNA methyltransferase [Fimbriimonas sp.]|nr:RsmE family RNA methyltransferase [Fimbriimonas sp.]